MDRDPSSSALPSAPSTSGSAIGPESLKLIEWEDYEQDASRLWSLTSALEAANAEKTSLEAKLQSVIEVEAKSLNHKNVLDEMREKLEAKKVAMDRMALKSKVAAEEAKKEEERLSAEVRSLLVAGTALSVASKQLQESNRSLAGDRGYARLRNIQKTLRLRQQYMTSQVSLLYPVKMVAGPSEEQELESFPSSSRSGYYIGSKPVNQGSLTILGLHLTLLPFTKMTFFTDKKAVQKSATALGYVAHAVLLLGSYLDVPLRYPLRLGGSRSYVSDHAPAIEPSSLDPSSSSLSYSSSKPAEFPLFVEGQDTTRAAYAVFLLNKDLEQLLNYIGVKSLGPRNVLANLKELIRTIQSAEFLET